MNIPRVNTAISKSASGGLSQLPGESTAVFPQWMKDRDPSMAETEKNLNNFIHETITCLDRLSSGVAAKSSEKASTTDQKSEAVPETETQPTETQPSQSGTTTQPSSTKTSSPSRDYSAQFNAIQSAISAISTRLDGIASIVSENSLAIAGLSFKIRETETANAFTGTLSWGNIVLTWGNNLLAYKE
jgi:DNA polymerase III alpha subunit (gram-positive type)